MGKGMEKPARKSMTKRMLIMFGGVVLLVALLAGGFYLHIRELMAAAPKPGPQTVSAMHLQALQWQPQLAAVGGLSAVRGVDVSTEVAGLVRQVNFKSGQEVKAGALLVQLDDSADQALLNSLQAAAELSASVLARDRLQLAALAIGQAQVDADAADLKSKRALVAQQQAVVAKKSLRAPFAGKLGISTVNPGQYLNPGATVVTLQALDPIYLDFSLPQKQLGKIALGQQVHVGTDAFAPRSFTGRISAISPKVDASTRSLQIEATVPNPKHELLPGMFANALVDVGENKRTLTLPQTAITYNPYGSTVFVVEPAHAAPAAASAASGTASAPAASGLVVRQVFVITGDTRGDQVEIVKGLHEGQLVVTSGQLKLKNGTPVVIDNSVQPANNPRPTPQE